MLELRDYQNDIADAIRRAWGRLRAVLAVLPTGAGKTVVFSSIMQGHTGAAAAVVHRKEIVSQIACSLAALGVKHRVVAPPGVVALIRRKQLKQFGRSFVDPHAQCGVVSVQTMTSPAAGKNKELQRWLAQVTLAVFDEGHHYVKTGLWAKAVAAVGHAKLLFVTATPDRADGQGLGATADGFADIMLEGPNTKWLIEQGYLSPFKYIAPQSDLDVSGVPITASGDLNVKALRARVVESHLVGDVVQHYLGRAKGKRAIVFASDVQTAEEMAGAFIRAGVRAAALSGKTDPGERDKQLERFEAGELHILVNVDLFDEGFDVPAVDAVILARPTESLAKFLQMVGRGMRPVFAEGFDLGAGDGRLAAIAAGGKPHALIIDPVRNWERHGMPNWPRVWSMDGRVKGARAGASDATPQRVCVECSQPYEAYYTACPYCGARAPVAGRSGPEQVDGDLQELDVDAMAALFEKMAQADADDDDYALGQISRNVPPIGRAADLKRHRTGKYRRKVLRELVAWWVGSQPGGRSMNEKHRRFYHRFGVDIGTAFTLSAKETDELIERIQQRFIKDM